MKNGVKFFLAVVFTIIPLCESNAASIDDFFGRTYLEIEPRYTQRLMYEDNIDGDQSGKDRISGWSNRYIPEILVTGYSPQVSISSSARLNIVEYTSKSDFNYVDQDYTFGLGYLPNERFEFSLDAGYSVTNNNYLIDNGGGFGLGDDYGNYKQKTWDYSAGVSYQLSPRSSIGLTGFLTDYETETSDDTQFMGFMVSYITSLSPRTNVLVNGNYFYYDFSGNQRKPDPGDPFFAYSFLDQTINNYSLTVGLEHNFANESRFSIMGGVRYTDQDTNSTKASPVKRKDSGSGQGWIVDIQWQRRWTEWMQAFEAHHDISVNPWGSAYEATRLISRTTYYINQRFFAKLSLQVEKAEGDGNEFAVDRDTRYFVVQPSLEYKLYRWLNVSMGYQYRYVDYKRGSNSSTHYNIFYIDLNFIPLRNLVVR